MYYDGTKLLSLNDINGNKPEIYLCTTNRSAGKTTYFSRYCVNRFLKYNEKFMLLYRFIYELDNVADKFFKDINHLFFPSYTMTANKRASGTFYELYLNKKSCGYAVALNSADQIKKYSHFFSDTKRILFDEFQSETNHYCAKEIEKFISVHTSVARGQGEPVRYVPCILIGNAVSILNPYFVEMGISDKLKNDTNFLRGDGYVLEQGFNDTVAKKQESSLFNRCFANNVYTSYARQNTYLNDSTAFIENVEGKSVYLATLKFENNYFALREYTNEGFIYCTNKADMSYPYKICITTQDHDINYVMLKHNNAFIQMLRYFFDNGCFRFKNALCKNTVLKLLSY